MDKELVMDGQMTEHQAKEIMESAKLLSYRFNTSRLWIDREDLVGTALMSAVKCYKRWDEMRGPFNIYAKCVMYYAMLERVRGIIKTRCRGIRKYQIPLSQVAVDSKYAALVGMLPASEEVNMFELREELEFWRRFFRPIDWNVLQRRYMEYKYDHEIGTELGIAESTVCLQRRNAVRNFHMDVAVFVTGDNTDARVCES